MKYVLGFLFEYKYYKNPANIKIFSNNQLIDEVDLTEDIKIKNMSGNMLLHKNTPLYDYYQSSVDWQEDVDMPEWEVLYNEEKSRVMNKKEIQIPSKMFIYTLDETVLQNSIKIEVTNDNSNYTNGFMTKWSSFIFHDVFLLPTYYLDVKNFIEFQKIQLQKKHNMPNYPRGAGDVTYGLIWPNEHRVVKNGELLDGTELEKMPSAWKKWTKGGSFSIELPIIEYIHEKGLKMLGPINYEQLTEKEKRHVSIDIVFPLYFEYLTFASKCNPTRANNSQIFFTNKYTK